MATALLSLPAPDRITVAYQHGVVSIWDLPEQECLAQVKTKKTFSLDGCFATNRQGDVLFHGDDSGLITQLDVPSLKLVRTSPAGKHGPIKSIVFVQRNHVLITGHENGTIVIWDAKTLQEKRVLVGHYGPVLTLALSPDERRLASGSADTTGIVWNIE